MKRKGKFALKYPQRIGKHSKTTAPLTGNFAPKPASARTHARNYNLNRPRSIYQISNVTPRLSGKTSIFGVVFFVSKSLLGIDNNNK